MVVQRLSCPEAHEILIPLPGIEPASSELQGTKTQSATESDDIVLLERLKELTQEN